MFFFILVLESVKSEPALVAIALLFAENAIKVFNATAKEIHEVCSEDHVKELLDIHFERLSGSSDQNVLQAHFMALLALASNTKTAEALAVERRLQIHLLTILAGTMSYHVINLAVQLFLRLLTILTEMAQKSTIGNAQVNPKKIRQNLLSEYFEKMSCGQLKKRVLNQLRYFLKNTCDLELKAVFYEFISMSLDDSYLEVSYNDFCSLRIESFVCGNDSKCRNPFENLIQHSNWKIRLAAVYEMLKHLQSRTDFVGHILGKNIKFLISKLIRHNCNF